MAKSKERVTVLKAEGDWIVRDKKRVNTLPDAIEDVCNSFFKKCKGEVIEIRPTINFGGAATGGSALILVRHT